MKIKVKKPFSRDMIMRVIGVVMYCAALVLLIILYFMGFEKIAIWYDGFRTSLIKIEYFVVSIEYVPLLVSILLLLFALKGVVAMLPTTTLCFISGMVLSTPQAFALNMVGVSLMMFITYMRGYKKGGGNAEKLLTTFKIPRTIFEKSENLRPILLFAFRFLPLAPVKTISRLYGSMKFNIWEYMIISIGAYAPRIISFTIIGRNIFDPLSASFIMPIVALLMLSGTSVLIANLIFNASEKRNKRRSSIKAANE